MYNSVIYRIHRFFNCSINYRLVIYANFFLSIYTFVPLQWNTSNKFNATRTKIFNCSGRNSRQLSRSVMFYAGTMSGVLRLINREKKTQYYYVAHTDESPTRLRKWDQSIGPRAESLDEAIVEKRRGDNGAINRVMWGHFIELSMRSTLAYLRSMDTGTLLFERTLTLSPSLFPLSLSLTRVHLSVSLPLVTP